MRLPYASMNAWWRWPLKFCSARSLRHSMNSGTNRSGLMSLIHALRKDCTSVTAISAAVGLSTNTASKSTGSHNFRLDRKSNQFVRRLCAASSPASRLVNGVFPKIEGPARREGGPKIHKAVLVLIGSTFVSVVVETFLRMLGLALP